MRSRLLVLSFLVLLSMPAAAEAAQRYAGPSGSGVACSQAVPCSYQTAMFGANDKDEVIVLPGDHTVSGGAAGPMTSTNDVHVHGVDGQPRPRILVGTGSTGLSLPSAGSTARDLQFVTSSDGAGISFQGSVAQRIIVTGSGTRAACTLAKGAQLRDSVCSSTGGDGTTAAVVAFGTAPGTVGMRNVTAYAPNGYGVLAQPQGAHLNLTMTNVIARGGDAFFDLDAQTNGGFNTFVTIDHSNYNPAAGQTQRCGTCTISEGAGNQSATPLFRDADLRQAAGSPTVDNGVNEADIGRTDPDGRPRTINGTTDIGAYEQTLAPGVTTGDASDLTQTGATLGGTVTANLEPAVYRFEYGATTGYGSVTPDGDAGSGGSAQSVSAAISGLAPSTTYHYRVAATNARGTTYGADRTFTTAAAPATTTTNPPVLPATTSAPALPAAGSAFSFRGMSLSKKRVPFRRGVARVRLSCPAAAPALCTGTLRILARRGLRWVTVARKSFSIAPGRAKTLRLRLEPSARKAGLRVRVSAKARVGAGPFRTRAVVTRLRRG